MQVLVSRWRNAIFVYGPVAVAGTSATREPRLPSETRSFFSRKGNRQVEPTSPEDLDLGGRLLS